MILKEDEFYMDKALKAAQQGGSRGNPPFGCCLVYAGGYLCTFNSTWEEGNPLKHAEINALEKFYQKIKKKANIKPIAIYTTVEPCLMCLGAIAWCNVTRVCYGIGIEESREMGFREFNMGIESVVRYYPYNLEIKRGILEEACRASIQQWKRRAEIINCFLH